MNKYACTECVIHVHTKPLHDTVCMWCIHTVGLRMPHMRWIYTHNASVEKLPTRVSVKVWRMYFYRFWYVSRVDKIFFFCLLCVLIKSLFIPFVFTVWCGKIPGLCMTHTCWVYTHYASVEKLPVRVSVKVCCRHVYRFWYASHVDKTLYFGLLCALIKCEKIHSSGIPR